MSITISGGDLLTYSWCVNSSLCSLDNAGALNPHLICSDNGIYTATLSVNDGANPAVTSSASVTVSNAAPSFGTISVNALLLPVGTAITASATLTDPGTLNTYAATTGTTANNGNHRARSC